MNSSFGNSDDSARTHGGETVDLPARRGANRDLLASQNTEGTDAVQNSGALKELPMISLMEDLAPGTTRLDLTTMSDGDIAVYCEALAEHRQAVIEDLKSIEEQARAELKRRMLQNNARALADPRFEKIALEDVYSPYAFDLAKLAEAKLLLPEDEGAKILKHVPEQVTIVPEHVEPGAAVSIAALIRRYGADSKVGKLLSEAMTRTKLDEKVVIKPRKLGAA